MTVEPLYLLTAAAAISVYFIKKWIGRVDDNVADGFKAIDKVAASVADINITIAVLQTKIADAVQMRKELDEANRKIILLEQQAKAAWRSIDTLKGEVDKLKTTHIFERTKP